MLKLSFDVMSVQRYVPPEETLKSLPSPAVIGIERIVAFEDHEYFVYLRGTSLPSERDHSALLGTREEGILRRVFFIRPDLMVVDDQMDARIAREIVWTLKAPAMLDSAESEVCGTSDGLHFQCRSLLPEAVKWNVGKDGDEWWRASHSLQPHLGETTSWNRLLHVVSFAKDAEAARPTCTVERQGSSVRLEILDGSNSAETARTIRLWMPDGPASGKIEIVGADRKLEVAKRLLPAGIMAPGTDAANRRLQWDLPYQIEGMAAWDTKQPSSQLKRAVEHGELQPCRAVELGCGTGNDAIFLASRGFDVTAIDISPTALEIAERKATEAGVRAHWVLADILQPPDFGSFDFVYDRGCYHEVRRHHADTYVEAVRSLTHDGSKILILAGSVNKDSFWRFQGPPRVRESEICKDFSVGFRLLQLSEFRFDPAPPEREGALAWSILLKRVQLDSEKGGKTTP